MQNLCSADFFKPTHYNPDTRNQLWMSVIADCHDSICNCWHPFAHLLASIFLLVIRTVILQFNKYLKEISKKHAILGGAGGESHGMADGGDEDFRGIKEEREEEDLPEEEIEGLLAAVEGAATR